jgi:hypothetical protein
MVLGLLAPELVLWNAWEQRKKVKKLNACMRVHGFMPQKPDARERVCRWFERALQKIRAPFAPGDKDPHELADLMSSRTHNNRLNDWTDVHSWLVVMGGMVFEDKSPEDQQFMPGNRTCYPITLDMIEWMAESFPDLVPDISREYIEDKSKSDWLAKGLTCWQAGYFCIQCAYRLSQQLSITLLELNVFAHAICALLLFLVWWDKPRDVLVPTGISSEEALDVCAAQFYYGSTAVDTWGTKYSMHLLPIRQHPLPDECFEIVAPTTITVRRNFEKKIFMTLSDGTRHEFLKVRGTYWCLRDASVDRLLQKGALTATDRSFESDIVVEFTGRDISRLERVYRCSTQSESANGRLRNLSTPRVFLEKYRTSNWSLGADQLDLLFEFDNLSDHSRTIAGITFASACYGGLHLIAWTSAFPSHAALVMWRAASVTLLATGPFCVAFAALVACSEWLYHHMPGWTFDVKEMVFLMIMCLVGFSLMWYTVCRAFIVVECFILLAHIPESALRVPTWAAYIPSFG